MRRPTGTDLAILAVTVLCLLLATMLVPVMLDAGDTFSRSAAVLEASEEVRSGYTQLIEGKSEPSQALAAPETVRGVKMFMGSLLL